MIKQIMAAAAMLLAAVAGAQPAPVEAKETAAPGTGQIYVVRHLQKETGDDPPLSAEGAALAGQLAERLSGSGITAIFATSTRRAMQTAAPLAERLGIAVQAYDPRNPDALVRAAAAAPGNVLVVGHSNTVDDLVGRFGGVAPAPLGEGDYGTIWHVDRAHGRTCAFPVAAGDSLTAPPAER